jgi:hypothetical protein
MTLSSWQRINVAMATGFTLRGTMKFDCLISHLTAAPSRKGTSYSFTVEAENPSDAARNAASRVAKKHYNDGEPGFVHEQGDGRFLAVVGQQSLVNERGIVTHGFTITITVTPHTA